MIRSAAACAALLAAAGAARAQDRPLSPEDLYERLAPSVWLVETMKADDKGSLGSAVVIARTELITNCHVVDGATVIAVSHGGARIRATLRYKDPERDLCQISAPGLDSPAVEIAPESTLRVGAKVYALGNPSGMTLTLTDGLLSALRRDKEGKLQAVQMSVPISPGSSGGGLFDVYGRLVGVVTFYLKDAQNLNFALPGTWVVELPRRAGGGEPVARIAPIRPPAPAAPPASPPAPRVDAPAPEIAAPGPKAEGSGRFALAPGTVFEYRLRDRLSQREQPVVYRLDRMDGTKLVFNDGQRIESPAGGVIWNVPGPGGEFDIAMPPGGWVPSDPKPGASWDVKYDTGGSNASGPLIGMQLQAVARGESTVRIRNADVRVVQVEFTGYTERRGGLGTSYGRYRAAAWYAPELHRIVHFEAATRGGSGGAAFIVDEELDLVDIRRE